MNKPPFSLPPLGGLQTLLDTLPPPPPWLQAELHNRLVLLLNHVLMQEPAATERLKRQCGKTVQVHWDMAINGCMMPLKKKSICMKTAILVTIKSMTV
ncbi:MAG: hypothetical protein PHW78_05450 [Macromonas bipunctata]|nr:hypothetical protein [Macromonas bipunctata]